MVIEILRYTVNSWGAPGYVIERDEEKIRGLEREAIVLEDVGGKGMQLMWPKWLVICGASIQTIKKYLGLSELSFEIGGKCLNPIEQIHILTGDFVLELRLDSFDYEGTKRNQYGRVEKVNKTRLKYTGAKIYMCTEKHFSLLKSIYGNCLEEVVITEDFVKMVLEKVKEI